MAQSVAQKSPIWLRTAIAVLILLSLSAIIAHIQILRVGDDYRGALAPLDRLFDLLLAGFLISVAFCVGRAASRLLSLEFANLAEEISVSIMMGTGLIGTGVLLLGLAGLLKLAPVAVLLIGVLVLSRRQIPRLAALVGDLMESVRAAKSRRLCAFLFLILIAVLVVRTLMPPHAVDEAIYHLSVTKLFVQQGRVYPVYDNFSGNLPFLVHMIYAICLIAKADIAAKLFSLALTIASSLAIYGFCSRFLGRGAAMIAMFAFFGAGMVVEVGVTSRIDVSLAGMSFLAAYAMMIHLEEDHRGWLLASAVLAGFSLGIKYTAGVWILLLGVMYLVESLIFRRRGFARVLKLGVYYAVIAAAVAAPWLVKNEVWFHNPVYPFITGEVAEYENGSVRYFGESDQQKLRAHFEAVKEEAPELVAEIETALAEEASRRPQRHTFRFWEYFTRTDLYALGDVEAYHDPNYLFFVVPFAFLSSRRRWLVWLGLLVVAFYLFLASTSWIARYLLPIYPPLTILAAQALMDLADRLRSYTPRAVFLPAVAVAVAVSSTVFVTALQAYVAGAGSFITGSLSRRDFMSAAFYYPPLDFINRNTEPNARVLMIGSQMCYDLDRDYLAEGGWDSVAWERLLLRNDSLSEVNQDLKRQGIGYVVFGSGLFKFVAINGRAGSGPSGSMYQGNLGSGLDYQVQLQNWTTFEAYKRGYLETVQAFRDYEVLKLK